MFGRKARCCAKSFVQKQIYEGRKNAGAQFTLMEKCWCSIHANGKYSWSSAN